NAYLSGKGKTPQPLVLLALRGSFVCVNIIAKSDLMVLKTRGHTSTHPLPLITKLYDVFSQCATDTK
ncbi:MAG: hypothetical protein FWC73_14075, partial [Defluviitaleaceae bacterium]|nr:hypothetical protein [Defluviitaleaceae bacterium]